MKWGPCLQGGISYDRGTYKGQEREARVVTFELDFEECVGFQGCGAEGGEVPG